MMVLKVRDTNQRGHVEVRGKKGYETKHNKRDRLHKFLDQLDGPTVSTLLGTEDEITLNPKNPDRKQTIKVVNDLIQKNEVKLIENNHHKKTYFTFPKREDVLEFKKLGKKFF